MTQRQARREARRLAASLVEQALGAGGWTERVDSLERVYTYSDMVRIEVELRRLADTLWPDDSPAKGGK